MDVRCVISQCEDFSDGIVRRTRKILPFVGRFLLVSTFIEDGFRLLFNSSDHAKHFSDVWYLNLSFSFCLTFLMSIFLLISPVFILMRKKVSESCGVLAVVLVIQVILYQLYTTYHLLTRNLCVLAALLLLVTENMLQKPKTYNQLPQAEDDISMTSLMLMGCRFFLNFILLSMVHFDLSYTRLFLSIISYGLMAFVIFGYKTRLMSVVLATWLFIFNIFANDFWNRDRQLHVVRYDFFQTLSAVGGLLLLMQTGPGELSVDELKKQW